MMEKFYWKIRKYYKKIIFIIKKRFYTFSLLDYKRKFNNSFWKVMLKELIKQLIINTFIIFVIFRIDSLINFACVNAIKIDYILFSDLLIAAVGIAGVFLGLYCSNMMSVFTSRYMNAPEILIGLFERDLLLNKCIKRITNFLISAIIILIFNFIGLKPGILLIVYCFLNAISILVSYSMLGKHSFQISDTYKITRPLYLDIYKCFDIVTKNKLFRKDINFQNHCYKATRKNIMFVNEIIDYTLELPIPKEAVMKAFLNATLELLKEYWNIKHYISYDSYWYSDRIIHSQWHKTDDSIITIALNTGTSLKAQKEKDFYWLESSLLELSQKCLKVLLNENQFKNLYRWSEQISNLCTDAVNSNNLDFYLKYIDELKELIFDSITSKESKYSAKEKMSLVEGLMIVYVKIVLAIRYYIDNLNIEKILMDCCKYLKSSDLPNDIFFNHSDVKKLYDSICVEVGLEKEKVTPDWYIQQIIAKHIYDNIIKLYVVLDKILNTDVPKLSQDFLEQKFYAETMLIYSRMTELKSKSYPLVKLIDCNIEMLRKFYIEKSIIWEENPVANFEEKQNNVLSLLPENWYKCSCYFTLTQYEKIDEFPDFLGECYNYMCECLIKAIEREDFESFSTGYKNIWRLAFLYQDVIRKDLIKIKEPHFQDMVVKIICNPIIDCGEISGYAYLLGEISGNESWTRLVEEVFKESVTSKMDDESAVQQRCERISEQLSITKFIRPAIYNRDVIHMEWKQRFERKLLSSSYLRWKREQFQLVLDTDNSLLKAVIGSPDMANLIYCNAYDVFAVKILNEYLDNDKKFKSNMRWEDEI